MDATTNIKDEISVNVGLGMPIEYKGLKIYPVKMKDYKRFMDTVDIFNYDKNATGDINLIQMSYLEFLIYIILGQDDIKNKFIDIIELCFNIKYNEGLKNKSDNEKDALLMEDVDGKVNIYINGRDICFIIDGNKVKIIIGDTLLSAKDFDNIKRIILYQNIEGYDDRPMSNDFKSLIKKYYSLKNRGVKTPTLEYKIGTVLSSSGYTLDKILDMPIRIFDITFSSIVDKYDYIVNMMALTQGAKIEPEHWVYKKDKDIYDDIFSDPEELRKKIM